MLPWLYATESAAVPRRTTGRLSQAICGRIRGVNVAFTSLQRRLTLRNGPPNPAEPHFVAAEVTGINEVANGILQSGRTRARIIRQAPEISRTLKFPVHHAMRGGPGSADGKKSGRLGRVTFRVTAMKRSPLFECFRSASPPP